MKIAVTSTGQDITSEVDPRFGRAPYILVVDSDSMDIEVIDNRENANSLKGAGIQAASAVSKKGAQVLLTGHCGPNAFKALKAAGIAVVNGAQGTVSSGVKAYLEGNLKEAEEPGAEGHW
ncbi:MAG: NifB/NifX family molybdenum-iron cluster-binding protein [Deltaproteobacteria bacterium]|nr:NifB/NifX family molybdenum-iron cluster-binding protein [Deltaproteobacteria bacterium]MBW1927580.1 NifB/NifX family molybdenum-iron cluster-binding protein [Deltaproteobacteria bacterium]MBW2024631.1 NifB/NifX family molybdenum-iron cluster-binding protein [Deltaproteobacteria bacterium]MBW2125671.1 NifB/NifX family molybdenum-iron cluster-binding protein [Deltaproteobacteria bacterium]RLB24595.1 MAG: dinitrogenase iron-molybdenum cofactor biosynthesis protein [Deltaproteobacteria bacteriu